MALGNLKDTYLRLSGAKNLEILKWYNPSSPKYIQWAKRKRKIEWKKTVFKKRKQIVKLKKNPPWFNPTGKPKLPKTIFTQDKNNIKDLDWLLALYSIGSELTSTEIH